MAVPPGLQYKVYQGREYIRAPDDGAGDTGMPTIWARCTSRGSARCPETRYGPLTSSIPGAEAQQIFGSLQADAAAGFPVACYPHCLQEADAHAQVVDLDLAIIQDGLVARCATAGPGQGAHVDAQRLSTDPAAGRYQ